MIKKKKKKETADTNQRFDVSNLIYPQLRLHHWNL